MKFIELPKYTEAFIDHHFSEPVLKVLQDIHDLLALPHQIQELLSTERTPTLALVLPAYEKMIVGLRNMQKTKRFKKLSHAIDAAATKLETYFAKIRKTRIIALAMGVFLSLTSVLNPPSNSPIQPSIPRSSYSG